VLRDEHFSVVTTPIIVTCQATSLPAGTTAHGARLESISSAVMSVRRSSASPAYDGILGVTSFSLFLTLVGIVLTFYEVVFDIYTSHYFTLTDPFICLCLFFCFFVESIYGFFGHTASCA